MSSLLHTQRAEGWGANLQDSALNNLSCFEGLLQVLEDFYVRGSIKDVDPAHDVR